MIGVSQYAVLLTIILVLIFHGWFWFFTYSLRTARLDFERMLSHNRANERQVRQMTEELHTRRLAVLTESHERSIATLVATHDKDKAGAA